MKRKSIKNQNNFPVPLPFDLFGEIPVTKTEVIQWVENVARLPANSPRFEWYVKNWRVVDKIRRVKQDYLTLDNYLMPDAANDSHY